MSESWKSPGNLFMKKGVDPIKIRAGIQCRGILNFFKFRPLKMPFPSFWKVVSNNEDNDECHVTALTR